MSANVRRDAVINQSRQLAALSNGNPAWGGSQRKVLSNVLGRQICQRMVVAAQNPQDWTYRQVFALETHATRFRFKLYNANTAQACQVKSAAIAVTNRYGATVAEQFTPSTGLWLASTFGGNAAPLIAAPAASSLPTGLWSDWQNISTLPRADGSGLPLVMVMAVFTSASYYTYTANDMTPWASESGISQGRFMQNFRYAGDAGAGNPSAFVAAGNFPYGVVMEYEYASKLPGYTFYFEGDSITEGATGNANFGNGWVWQAINLLRKQHPDLPIDVVNGAISSTATNTFLQRFQAKVADGTHFDAVVYSLFSPNDGTPSQASVDAMISRLAQVSEAVFAAGKQLIVTTPCPNTAAAWTAPQDAFRLELVFNLLRSRGQLVIDLNAALSDGAVPARFLIGTTDDGTHPNEYGHLLAARAAVPVLSSCLPV